MKRAGPTGLLRAGIAASLGLASAVLVPIACGVDTQPSAPPRASTSSGSGGGASGSGSEASSVSVGSGVGPATLCECATAAFTPESTCADCFHQVAGIDCAAPVTACQSDPVCVALLIALDGCHAAPQCVATTLATHPGRNAYLDVLVCVCVSCGASCAAESTVSCDAGKIPVEAGSDADLDAADADTDAAMDAADDAAIDAIDAMDDAADPGDGSVDTGG